MIESQWELPDDATAIDRLICLIHHSPLLHKLGQLIGRHPQLDSQIKRAFQSLESRPNRPLPAAVEQVLNDQLPKGATHHSTALAEASIAFVVAVQWDSIDAVVKVKKPCIDEYLAEDLRLAVTVSAAFDEACEQRELAPLNVTTLIGELAEKLCQETDFLSEQRHLQNAFDDYRHSDVIVVPELLPFSNQNMTAMTRVHGELFTHLSSAELATRIPPTHLIRELLAKPFWRSQKSARFHGDPHGGNLMALPNGKIGVLDWSLVAELTKFERRQLVELAISLWLLNIPRMATALAKLFVVNGALKPAIHRLFRPRYSPLPSVNHALELVDQLALHGVIQLPGHFIILRKSVFTLRHLFDELAAHSKPAAHWETAFLEWGLWQALNDGLPWQWDDESTASHLSGFDLWGLWLDGPLVPTRFWHAALAP